MVFPFALIVAVINAVPPGQIVPGAMVKVTVGFGCMVTEPFLTMVQPCGVTAVSCTAYVPGAA